MSHDQHAWIVGLVVMNFSNYNAVIVAVSAY